MNSWLYRFFSFFELCNKVLDPAAAAESTVVELPAAAEDAVAPSPAAESAVVEVPAAAEDADAAEGAEVPGAAAAEEEEAGAADEDAEAPGAAADFGVPAAECGRKNQAKSVRSDLGPRLPRLMRRMPWHRIPLSRRPR